VIGLTYETTIVNKCLPFNQECSVSTNLVCSYSWVDNDDKIVSKHSVLTLDTASTDLNGIYRCKVACPVRDKVCNIETISMNVTSLCPGGNIKGFKN